MRASPTIIAAILASAPAAAASPVYVTEGEGKPSSQIFSSIDNARQCGISLAPLGSIPADFDRWASQHTYKDRYLPDEPAVKRFAARHAKAQAQWDSMPGSYRAQLCAAMRTKSEQLYAGVRRDWALLVDQHAKALPTTGHRAR